jgi:hypothetical protein
LRGNPRLLLVGVAGAVEPAQTDLPGQVMHRPARVRSLKARVGSCAGASDATPRTT